VECCAFRGPNFVRRRGPTKEVPVSAQFRRLVVNEE
jgi:hypothetical protein